MKQIKAKLNAVLPLAVLDTPPFGRSELESAWIKAEAISRVASELKKDPEISLDWLENLSVSQFEDILVVTYFVASYSTKNQIILRVSGVPSKKDGLVVLPSICSAWPMGEPMEREAAELFGMRFMQGQSLSASFNNNYLPNGWKGFPMRKDYVYPREFGGIQHEN